MTDTTKVTLTTSDQNKAMADLRAIVGQFTKPVSFLTDEVQKSQDGDLPQALALVYYVGEVMAELAEAQASLSKAISNMQRGGFPAMFERSGSDMCRIPELGRSFYPTTKYSAKTVDKDKLWAWLREQGHDDVITETVNSSTLAGLLKTLMIDEGIEAPADVVQLTSYQILGSSKYTPK